MEIGIHGLTPPANLSTARPGPRPRPAVLLLYAVGILLVLAAALYIAFVALNTWLMGQNRYLVADEVVPHSPAAVTWSASSAHAPAPALDVPVYLLIPALGIERSIINLPLVLDERTGSWTQNVRRLYRAGRQDLVGHWGGSAYLGQEGNVVLVGHNYGYGHEGVFLRLGRLKPGQAVNVVTASGKMHSYRVASVERVDWRRENAAELAQHTSLLDPGGPERLTLVTCAGSSVAPFAERIYVVAEPVQRTP
jgi:LPXTG-site transpeptidase (sortase) family protein